MKIVSRYSSVTRILVICGAVALLAPLTAVAKEPVPSLQDLIGVRGSSGEAQLEERGYEYVGGKKTDRSAWTYWQEPETGKCVAVDTVDGKYATIVYTAQTDCDNVAGAEAPVSKHDDDRMPTVCGVRLADGQELRYRCEIENLDCEGSGQCRTHVVMPDNAYTIIWHQDGAIQVKFQGMVAQDTTASFEKDGKKGETSFELEDKTYFLYRNASEAKRELAKLKH